MQVDEIDAPPDRARRRLGFRIVEVGVLAEIAARIAERRGPQAHEALDIPLLQQRIVGVQENREVEKVGDERNLLAVARQAVGQQDVDPFEDENVRAVDDDRFPVHDIVGDMRIDRRGDVVLVPP